VQQWTRNVFAPCFVNHRAGFHAAAAPRYGAAADTSTVLSDSASSPSGRELAREDASHFHRSADIYLGGLWNRFEAELRENEGEDFELS